MKKIFLVAFLIPVLSFTCLKQTPNCHKSITFKNNSDYTVFRAHVIKDKYNNCRYYLEEFKAGTSYTFRYGLCYEKQESPNQELYIVSPEGTGLQFQQQNFSCDSITKAYKVLKHYELSPQYLHEHNWEVNYPE